MPDYILPPVCDSATAQRQREIVETIRRVPRYDLFGVAADNSGQWYVYQRAAQGEWFKHCGPYSTREAATDWIHGIRGGHA